MPLFLLLCTGIRILRFSRIFFWDRGVGGWGVSYPKFFWIFTYFLYLQGPLAAIPLTESDVADLFVCIKRYDDSE